LVATRVVIVKEAADAAAVKKVVEEAAEKKKGAEEAAVKKKAVKEAAVKKVVEEAATKKKAAEEAAKKTAGAAAIAGSSPSPAPSVGVKREATPSGSTPPTKRRFLGSWKPWYDTQSFICHFLYRVCDFNLVSPAYNMSSSSRSPPSRGPTLRVQPKLLSPRTPSKPNRVTGLPVAAGSRFLA
jgi:hypothetical protein